MRFSKGLLAKRNSAILFNYFPMISFQARSPCPEHVLITFKSKCRILCLFLPQSLHSTWLI